MSNIQQEIPLSPLFLLPFFQFSYHTGLICLCLFEYSSGISQMQLPNVIALHPCRKLSLNAYPNSWHAWPCQEAWSSPLWANVGSSPLAECPFLLNRGQCINHVEVQQGDLFYPTQHIRFVTNLSFHCKLPGTNRATDGILPCSPLFIQLSAPGEWQKTAGLRCSCFSPTDLALMCQIKYMFLLYVSWCFSVSLHWVGFWFTWKAVLVIISILLSLFSLPSPDFSENDLIKNMELLFLRRKNKKVPRGCKGLPAGRLNCLHFPCSSTDPQVSPLAKTGHKICNSSSSSSAM